MTRGDRLALKEAVDTRRRAVIGLIPDPAIEAEKYTRKQSRAAAARLLRAGTNDPEILAAKARMLAACCSVSGLSDDELEAHALAAATVAVHARRRR